MPSTFRQMSQPWRVSRFIRSGVTKRRPYCVCRTFIWSNYKDERDSAWQQAKELLGETGGDSGHWNYSPEWWGSQGGSWGRDEGRVVFERESVLNGLVQVTSHPTRSDDGRQEWRVLRFNDVTRQSVCRVTVEEEQGRDDDGSATLEQPPSTTTLSSRTRPTPPPPTPGKKYDVYQHPECLASEYLKSVASLFAAVYGILRLTEDGKKGEAEPVNMLCIGVGGGSLPLFLAHHFANMTIDAVEIDPVVVDAAEMAMGFPIENEKIALHVLDAVEFLEMRQGQGDGLSLYDVIYVDAFDGHDDVPSALCSEHFARLVSNAMDTERAAFIMNFHDGDVYNVMEMFSRAVKAAGGRQERNSRKSCDGGLTSFLSFFVGCPKQQNLLLCCIRSPSIPLLGNSSTAKDAIKCAAAYVGSQEVAAFQFPCGNRAVKSLTFVDESVFDKL